MNEIHILDSSVFNRIAAGEVVERPLGVVKELVENSIDAKADTITVEIRGGGLELIKVTDNGCGIDREQIAKAFLPHATSKIAQLTDLDEISTLGFRGEALPSIASVAKVTMVSRLKDAPLGYYVKYERGILTEQGECGASIGTSVMVENLFSFVPARLKFMSKPSQEEAKITELMQRLILANPRLAFKYSANGASILTSSGGGIPEAVFSVYGREMLSNLQQIQGTMSGIVLEGYVNKPQFTKFSRGFQTLIVNGRYVENTDLSHYVYGCYSEYLMKRQFPVYVLYLKIPYDMVDVNVHPNKMEIKFVDILSIKKLLGQCIKEVLKGNLFSAREVGLHLPQEKSEQKASHQVVRYDVFKEGFSASDIKKEEPESLTASMPRRTDLTERQDTERCLRALESSLEPQKEGIAKGGDVTVSSKSLDVPLFESDVFHEKNDSLLRETHSFRRVLDSVKNQDVNDFSAREECAAASEGEAFGQSDYEQTTLYDGVGQAPRREFCVSGKLFDTYILIEWEGAAYFIDQHAAHERLIYDAMKKGYESRADMSQSMLTPFVFTVTPAEASLLREHLQEISYCGFDIKEFGGDSFSLSAIPAACQGLKLNDFVAQLLEKLQSKKLKSSDFMSEAIMQSACKAAVKGENPLSKDEIDCLLQAMENSDMVMLCPHGRPVAVKLKKSDVEKWFKRIV